MTKRPKTDAGKRRYIIELAKAAGHELKDNERELIKRVIAGEIADYSQSLTKKINTKFLAWLATNNDEEFQSLR